MHDGYEVISLDNLLSGNKGNAWKGPKLDWVLHFAARTSIEQSFKDPLSTYRDNYLSTLGALKIAYAGKAAFLYMSSYVYGVPKYLPVDEAHPVDPRNPYMGSKLIGEELAKQLCSVWEKPLIILRGFSIYGDCSAKGRLIADLVREAKNDRPLQVNDPKAKRDYLYIKDFCALIRKIVGQKKIRGGTYNVGYGKSYSTLEAAALIKKLARSSRIVVKSLPRRNDIADCRADIRLVSKTFSWKPAYSLDKGLAELLDKKAGAV